MSMLDMNCTHGASALAPAEIAARLAGMDGWAVADGMLERRFAFRDYHETMEFVNALAFMTHRQDHHPELKVTYNRCTVRYVTHSAGNQLSDNDFICAAKADALYAQRAGA
ncbi:4a-hydroxytetrahydrobiopterin dehydratase [Massilia cavernae]|uniref:Putative pterin-4-alpha-carbinolamine dehydratase n=1 Tax=Massilia cavernae TaxID=2320864 RepID=A0A418X801_9BURK|nr:4a-hydroxytetrahydrobiopterin dehydratase [Massilia cavernae]RJG08513.1 4a-hydroxytetrahydrobiopterin dehydratase [Massilia cavernae]